MKCTKEVKNVFSSSVIWTISSLMVCSCSIYHSILPLLGLSYSIPYHSIPSAARIHFQQPSKTTYPFHSTPSTIACNSWDNSSSHAKRPLPTIHPHCQITYQSIFAPKTKQPRESILQVFNKPPSTQPSFQNNVPFSFHTFLHKDRLNHSPLAPKTPSCIQPS